MRSGLRLPGRMITRGTADNPNNNSNNNIFIAAPGGRRAALPVRSALDGSAYKAARRDLTPAPPRARGPARPQRTRVRRRVLFSVAFATVINVTTTTTTKQKLRQATSRARADTTIYNVQGSTPRQAPAAVPGREALTSSSSSRRPTARRRRARRPAGAAAATARRARRARPGTCYRAARTSWQSARGPWP